MMPIKFISDKNMRNILITGASSGLGKAIAILYAEKGWNVIIVDIQDKLGKKLVTELTLEGKNAEYHHCDVGAKENFEALFKIIASKYKSLDILVNNAGIASAGTLESSTTDEWDRLIALDLMSVIYGTQVFLPLLKKSPKAHIVSTASFAGLANMPGMMTYNVAKAGVIAFSETLLGEMALYNIGVSVACPAFFPTNLVDSMDNASDKTKGFINKQMQTSGVSADDVAKGIFNGINKNEFIIMAHRKSRTQYLIKRLFPGFFMKQKIKVFLNMMKGIKK